MSSKQLLKRFSLLVFLILTLANCGGGGGGSDGGEDNTASNSDNEDSTSGGSDTGNNDSNDSNSALAALFPKFTSVFGISLYATAATSSSDLAHAARVMAEYLDNDENGIPDNQLIVDKMVERGATMLIAASASEMEPLFDQIPESGAFQDLYASEIFPNGASSGQFDATLEEVLHLITHVGFAGVYPSEFGEQSGSVIADAMDIARGGHFETIPSSYPAGAWYTYDDTTCEYDCMIAEYFYWALTSILGGQDFSGRLEEIQNEWQLNTAAKVQQQDTAIFALLTNGQYGLPTTLPDGNYAAATFDISTSN